MIFISIIKNRTETEIICFFSFLFYRLEGGHYGNKDIYPYFCPLPCHLGCVIIFICRYFVFIFNLLLFHLINLSNIILLYCSLYFCGKIYLSIYNNEFNYWTLTSFVFSSSNICIFKIHSLK